MMKSFDKLEKFSDEMAKGVENKDNRLKSTERMLLKS